MTTAGGGTRSHPLAGAALVLGSASCFAVMPIFGKLAYREGIEPIGLLAWRFTVAAVVLWGVTLLQRRSRTMPPQTADRRTFGWLIVVGAVLLAGEVALFFIGLQYLSAGLAEVLLFLFPAWVVIITAVARRSWPGAVVAGCTASAVAGAALAVLGSWGSSGQQVGWGVLLLVSASFVYAAYIIATGRAAAGGLGVIPTTTAVVTGAAGSFLVAAIVTGSAGPSSAVGYALAVAIAVVSTVFAFGLLSAGLARLPATHAAVIATAEPVLAVMLSAWLLAEPLTAVQAAGVALVVGSIVVILRHDARRAAEAVDLLDEPL